MLILESAYGMAHATVRSPSLRPRAGFVAASLLKTAPWWACNVPHGSFTIPSRRGKAAFRRPHKPEVAGSNPAGVTAYFAACVAIVASLIHFQVNPARTL